MIDTDPRILQTMSGIFNLLPLGLRVQNKIETLIDKHMISIGILTP